MAEMGKAMMGTGEAEGENRAIRAAELAISNPLLEDNNMAGARGLLINITGGEDMTLFEVDQAANRIREEVDEEANIIFGSAIDDSLTGKIRVSVVATGIDTPAAKPGERPRLVAVGGGEASAVSAVGQQSAPPVPAVAAGPAMIGNLALAQQPAQMSAQPGAQPAILRAAPPPPSPPGRAPQPGARVQPPYTLQPAAPRYAPQAQAAAPAPHAEQDAATGYEQAGYADAGRPQQPLRPAPRQPARPAASEPRIPGRSATLFAEPPPAPPPPAPRKSLFGLVTGAIRGHAAEHAAPLPAPAPVQRAEPTQHDLRGEPARASVRQAAGDDASIDIPAFLRRQSNN